MKHTRKVVNCLVACAIALALVSTSTAQTAKERTAKVVRVKGAARYSTGNNLWQPLEVGTPLRAGAIIQTAADSFVDIVLEDTAGAASFVGAGGAGATTAPAGQINYRATVEQDVVRLFADSLLAIDRLTRIDTGADQVTDTSLDLRSGRIFGTVKKLPGASRYEVKIPNGVAGIRGTSYMISADGVVSVYEGSVVIAYTGPDGTVVTQVVMGGFQFNVHTGAMTPVGPAPEVPSAAITTPTTFAEDHTVYFVSPH